MSTASKRVAQLVVAAMSSIATGASAQVDENGVENHQAAVDLQWKAMGTMESPGLAGLRGDVSGYLPVIPLYVGGSFSRAWGLSPSHVAGERAEGFSRLLTGTLTWEARVGFSFDGWLREQQSATYSFDHQYHGNYTTWKEDSYVVDTPVYSRVSVYAGYRKRSNPGATPCPDDDASLPEDCAETTNGFFLLGLEWLRAQDRSFRTKEHGGLRNDHHSIWRFVLMMSNQNAYGRTTLGKRIGGEIVYTFGKKGGFAGELGGGWDGENAIIRLGLGFGSIHSISDPEPPPSSSI